MIKHTFSFLFNFNISREYDLAKRIKEPDEGSISNVPKQSTQRKETQTRHKRQSSTTSNFIGTNS